MMHSSNTPAPRAARPLQLLLGSTLFAAASLSAGCGSSAPAIKHHMPMEMLAQTPPEERAPVADAYRAHYEATAKVGHLRYRLSDIEYELRIARAEKAQRSQEEKIAKLQSKRSEAAFKVDLAKTAQAAINGMKKQKRAQGERIRYLKAERTYLKRELAYAKLAVIEAEASFELAKAKLAQARETVPKGFKMTQFVTQEKRAKSRAQAKAQKARAAKAKAKTREQAWKRASK